MQKAYELKALGQMVWEEVKKDGLELAEKAVKQSLKSSYNGFKRWMSESSVMSENKADDIVVPFLSYIDGMVIGKIDGIKLVKDV